MQRSGKLITLFLILSGLLSCEGTTFRSSVPAYPVRVIVDTRIGAFVHFQPEALGSFVVANKEGYYLDNQWVSSSSARDAYGYGGVVVYIGAFGYNAYDLACPNDEIAMLTQIFGDYMAIPDDCYPRHANSESFDEKVLDEFIGDINE